MTKDKSEGAFPTNASALVDWNDESAPEVLAFTKSGQNSPALAHAYTSGGVYDIEIFIYNNVSGYSTNCTVSGLYANVLGVQCSAISIGTPLTFNRCTLSQKKEHDTEEF